MLWGQYTQIKEEKKKLKSECPQIQQIYENNAKNFL